MIRWKRCAVCPQAASCGEFFCALRVYPDGTLGACRQHPSTSDGRSGRQLQASLEKELRQMAGDVEKWTELMKLGIDRKNEERPNRGMASDE